MTRGRLITLEGGEGAGKTTQAARLRKALQSRGLNVVLTREPGGTPEGEAVRALLLEGADDRWDAVSEALLLHAARRVHFTRVIDPALARGVWVICDRFSDSTMAYQGCAMGLGREAVENLHRLALGDHKPDLTLILDLPAATGLARTRGGDRYARRSPAFHENLRQAFLDIARREPERCTVIDAAGDIDAVTDAVTSAAASLLRD